MQELAEQQFPDPLVFTDSAVSKVKELIEEEKNEELMLRVFISPLLFSVRLLFGEGTPNSSLGC